MPENLGEKRIFDEVKPEMIGKKEIVTSPEKEIDLSNITIGLRIFKIGEFDLESFERFKKGAESAKLFSRQFDGVANLRPPRVVIITNDDLPKAGKEILASAGLTIVQSKQTKAERRARLAKRLVGNKSTAKGEFSYADMLNSIRKEPEQTDNETGGTIFASSDLTRNPEVLSRQIIGMKILFNQWQEGRLAIIGSLIEGVHDLDLIQQIVAGTKNIDLNCLNKIFPNNALSLVPAHTEFSGITDNGLAGDIDIEGRPEPIGGNEDFLYGFQKMLYANRDCVLLIDPLMADKRRGEIAGVESKYIRRQKVYSLYAQRAVRQAVQRGIVPLPTEKSSGELSEDQINTIIENTVDNHLFFAKLDHDNQVKILLTRRQKLKSINPPIKG